MHIIEVIYIVSATSAIIACMPQLSQIYKAKASDELSLATWITWMITQMVSLGYVSYVGNGLLIVVSTAWVSFYALMVCLIVKYRRPVAVLAEAPSLTDEAET